MLDISVIVPVFNNIDIIVSLKNKIVDLSNRYKQIIIIDDCSTDLTYSVLKEFIEINCLLNIEVVKNSINMGPSFSRNIGIKRSKGEYIAFLDSDDDWHPQKIELQIVVMQKYNVRISGTVHKCINEADLLSENLNDYLSFEDIPISEIKWPKILFISPFATPSVVIHNTLKNYLFDEKIRYSEDYNLWKRITYNHKAIKILLPLTYTFKHDYLNSASSLSSNLKKMQLGVEKSFLNLVKSDKLQALDKALILIALLFSKLKYLRRIIKSRINK
jgi:glycosyltransferase involved in cell wall biosynthesis